MLRLLSFGQLLGSGRKRYGFPVVMSIKLVRFCYTRRESEKIVLASYITLKLHRCAVLFLEFIPPPSVGRPTLIL